MTHRMTDHGTLLLLLVAKIEYLLGSGQGLCLAADTVVTLVPSPRSVQESPEIFCLQHFDLLLEVCCQGPAFAAAEQDGNDQTGRFLWSFSLVGRLLLLLLLLTYHTYVTGWPIRLCAYSARSSIFTNMYKARVWAGGLGGGKCDSRVRAMCVYVPRFLTSRSRPWSSSSPHVRMRGRRVGSGGGERGNPANTIINTYTHSSLFSITVGGPKSVGLFAK